jgi:hypothetical protein
MSTIIKEKRLISLNSNNATQYFNGSYLSNLSFDFFSILSADESILYVESGVQSAQIPASFYNIDITNNVFSYTVSSIAYNIQIPPGNYNYSTLVTQMATLFLVNGHTFTFALNRSSNILTMTLTSVGTWNNILPSSIYYILGFNNTTTNVIANTITFTNLFDLLGQKKLKIYSKNLAIDSLDSVGNSTNNLIETISVNQPGFGMIIYNNIDSTYGHLKTSYLSTIDIQIKDELGNFINFNNINWTMTIVLIIFKELKVRQTTIDGITNEIQQG